MTEDRMTADRMTEARVNAAEKAQRTQPIVVGMDGSRSSDDAVRWAARHAALGQRPLRVVHAHVWPWVHQSGIPSLPSDYQEMLLAAATKQVQDAAAVANRAEPTVHVDTRMAVCTAVQLLVEESRDARLVVVGSRGLGGFSGLLVGSTAVGLAVHAHCPVAVVRGATPDGSAPVVVGVDGTEASDEAIGIAFEEADLRHAPLVAVHAWSDVSHPIPWPLAPADHDAPANSDNGERFLDARLAGWQHKHPDVEVRRVTTDNRPAQSLLHAADGAQLIVVGSRGRGDLGGLLFGSVSHALLHHSPCPVIITRGAATPPAAGAVR